MIVDAILYNAKIFFNGKLIYGWLAINNGRIVKISKKSNFPRTSNKFNLNNKILLPGLIDPHVHLRDEELSYKENFSTGTSAAAIGGYTSVIDMPNNKPTTMDSLSLKNRISLAKKRIFVNVGFNSAFPKNIEDISKIIREGALGFKIYFSKQLGGLDINDDELLLKAFNEVLKIKIPISIHAEDQQIIENKIKNLKKIKKNTISDYIQAHSIEAEVKSIKRVIELVKKSGVPINFCHLSSALGLRTILGAKMKKIPVTCEVTPHHLFLYLKDYQKFGQLGLTDPPLRTQNDVSILWASLKFGLIDIIASDHAPHLVEEKKANSIWKVKPGIPGLETTLPLLLTKVNEGSLSIDELVMVTAENPARIFGLKQRGSIKVGNWADLIVIDLKKDYKIDSSNFLSKAKYSPFNGLKVRGKVLKTFINGKLVMDEDKIINKPGSGKILRSIYHFSD